MAVAVPVLAAIVVLAVSAVAIVVRRRRRGQRGPQETVAEKALRAHTEQVAAQDRATQFHPDAVRDWMRPR